MLRSHLANLLAYSKIIRFKKKKKKKKRKLIFKVNKGFSVEVKNVKSVEVKKKYAVIEEKLLLWL